MDDRLFEYRGELFPDYIRRGNACEHIAVTASYFCRGSGLDIGASRWPLPGAIAVDMDSGGDAMALPKGSFDFIFSSHCLEHLANPVAALEHWKSRLNQRGVLFLYLPHAESMRYWRPQTCRKHLHAWRPNEMEAIIRDLGFVDVIRSERDLYWSFAVVGFVHG